MNAKLRQIAGLCLLALAAWGAGQGLKAWQARSFAEHIAATARPGDIVMISSLTCVYCREAREWFTARDVPFHECFIEQDAACADAYRRMMSPGTPTLLVRGQRQVGFNVRRVASALGHD